MVKTVAHKYRRRLPKGKTVTCYIAVGPAAATERPWVVSSGRRGMTVPANCRVKTRSELYIYEREEEQEGDLTPRLYLCTLSHLGVITSGHGGAALSHVQMKPLMICYFFCCKI